MLLDIVTAVKIFVIVTERHEPLKKMCYSNLRFYNFQVDHTQGQGDQYIVAPIGD